jgi:hypothetical protein
VLGDARAWVVDRLCAELPYLERHLLLVDSVHDGLPLWCFEPALLEAFEPRTPQNLRSDDQPIGVGAFPVRVPRPVEIERAEIEGVAPRAEPAERQLDIDPPGYLAVGGEPLRGPIERTLLVGPSVLPALGQEGRLLAACGAARLVTQSDKRKARVRREMWTKLEIS